MESGALHDPFKTPMPGTGPDQLSDRPECEKLAEVPMSHLYTPNKYPLVPTVPFSPSTDGHKLRKVGETSRSRFL